MAAKVILIASKVTFTGPVVIDTGPKVTVRVTKAAVNARFVLTERVEV